MGNEKENSNGWHEYSKLVLNELENLSEKTESISKDLTDTRQEIKENGHNINRVFDELGELKEWRKNVSEIVSPTQLKELSKEVEDLKTFKTKSTTAWVVVQILFGVILALLTYFKVS